MAAKGHLRPSALWLRQLPAWRSFPYDDGWPRAAVVVFPSPLGLIHTLVGLHPEAQHSGAPSLMKHRVAAIDRSRSSPKVLALRPVTHLGSARPGKCRFQEEQVCRRPPSSWYAFMAWVERGGPSALLLRA